MTDRLQAAQAALTGGRRDEAIEHLIAAVEEDPARSVQVYRALAMQLYNAGRHEEGVKYAGQGAKRFPKDYDLLNVWGVLLRQSKRQHEAIPVFEAAIKLNPKNHAAQQNLGNSLLDVKQAGKAEAVFAKLVRMDPRNAEYQRQLGRALYQLERIEPALVRFRQAVSLKRDAIDAWLDMVGALNEEFRAAEAGEALDRALAANPGNRRLLEGKAMVLRRSGQLRQAEAFLADLLANDDGAAWAHYQLGMLIADWDRDRANQHLRKAAALEPDQLDYSTGLVESLERTRTGDEGASIEEAYQLALTLAPRQPEFNEAAKKILTEVFLRVSDFDAMDAVGDFKTLGRAWASSGRHTALLKQLARVGGDEDRRELLEQHLIWGRDVEKAAARRPIKRPPAPKSGKIRLGFMSSDLRQHPVGYFAMPLFDNLDNDRFEVFVYSYYLGPEDPAQKHITSRIKAYRWWPDVGVGEAAQRIADDQLDMLIELGGSTHMNKLEVMAYRPAPIQASWLGYPHSAGLSSIDYLICDPHNVPERRDLLVEKPLLMPKTWIALGERFFSNRVEIDPVLPEERNGFITYGTANNPHKYTAALFKAWARVVAETPNSQFAFLRPEGSSPSFRRNIARHFAEAGVSEDRLRWFVVRGAHLPYYNQIDISLDTFPLTGGTTTTESLWMGVPVVSLRGPAFYERLSASILANSGLPDLVSDDLDGFTALALELAADRPRRAALRQGLREAIRSGPLGQTAQFAQDFYDMIAGVVAERRR